MQLTHESNNNKVGRGVKVLNKRTTAVITVAKCTCEHGHMSSHTTLNAIGNTAHTGPRMTLPSHYTATNKYSPLT